jgi:uncharacterized protein (TIGR00255 family)
MPLVSMTGFAETQGHTSGVQWRWEAKSVNGRGLDVRLRLPPGFDNLESQARILAAGKFKRGNLQVGLTMEREAATPGLKIDYVALAAAVKVAQDVASETGLAPARIDGLLALKGVIVPEEAEALTDEAKDARDRSLLESLAEAFAALDASRTAEGEKLAVVLAGQIDEIERLTAAAGALAATQPTALHERLQLQLADLVAPGTVSPDRLAQEVALLALRADVREELDRLKSHVGEARRLLESGEAVGRKLDFLSQEFNREANTLCSKSSDAELTRVGLDLKAVIDQFREQSANVE